MKLRTMTAASLLALMTSFPVHAADVSAPAVSGAVAAPSDRHQEGEATEDAARDIKAFFVGKDTDDPLRPILIHDSQTAHGLIGEAILNTKGEKIATLKDIIIDKNGRAILAVVSDNGFLGIGAKVTAFDYNKVVAQQPDGKVVMTLSQDMVDHAKDFSYDQDDWAKAKVIPADSISVDALLKGRVLDNNGKKVADIENVYIRDADASQLIVGFNKKLGLIGGDLAALDYDDLQMVGKDKAPEFKLSAGQSVQFDKFKKSVAD